MTANEICKGIKDFFENAPPEQIEDVMSALFSEEEDGITMEEYLKYWNKYYQ